MPQHQDKLKIGERAFNWVLLLFSLGVFYEAYRISGFSSISSAGAFPLGLGAIMITAMLTIIAGQFRKARPDVTGALDEARQFLHEHFPTPIVIFSLLAVGYLFVLQWLGFVISTVAFLFVSMVFLQRGRVVMAAIVSVISIAIIYALFTLLFQVYLP